AGIPSDAVRRGRSTRKARFYGEAGVCGSRRVSPLHGCRRRSEKEKSQSRCGFATPSPTWLPGNLAAFVGWSNWGLLYNACLLEWKYAMGAQACRTGEGLRSKTFGNGIPAT